MAEFSDVVDVTSVLTPPTGKTEYSLGPTSDLINRCFDLVSPTYWMTEVLDAVFGFNPLDEVLKVLEGDWEAYSRCGKLWGQVDIALAALAKNISAGNTAADKTWDGHAADAAYTYFHHFASQLHDIGFEFHKLQGGYDDAAQAVFFAAKASADYLGGLADAGTIIAIEMAAGTLLSVTGGGAVLAYGLAGLEVAQMLKLWSSTTKTLGEAQASVTGLMTVVKGASSALAKKTFKLPKVGTYDHPAPTV
jgi:hypothetical protein